MTVVYFGSDSFAREVLKELIQEGVPVKAVVTVPDREKGRSRKLSGTPVKEFAQDLLEIPLFQPEKPSSPEFLKKLKALNADLYVVVAYGKLLKQGLLDIPSIGTLNVHPSLLPKYRGPSPIQSAVLAGEKEVGVTIMEISLELDAGDIISVEKMSVDEDATFGEVQTALCQMSKKLLTKTVKQILKKKTFDKTPQDHSKATFSKKIHPDDAKIDFSKPAHIVHNLIRGMSPRPGARCDVEINGAVKNLKILKSILVDIEEEARFSDTAFRPGDVVYFDRQNGFVLKCKDRFLRILSLQLEGKKEMDAKSFINGFSQPLFLLLKHNKHSDNPN